MANQNGWNDEHRSYGGGDDDAWRRAQRRPDRGEDYSGRHEAGQGGGYGRFDQRDDHRYGGGSTSDYGYGQGGQYGGGQSQGGQFGGGQFGGGQDRYGQGRYGQQSNDESGRYPGRDYGSGAYQQSGEGLGYGSSGGDASRYGKGSYDQARSGGGYRQEPRSWWNRTSDQVSSWFGDNDAADRRQQDERSADQGSHRGRGPKDYTRSDDRIREDVNDRLTDDHHIDASTVSVTVKDGEVTLSGTIAHRNDKRHAEDLAESVSGVKHVQNNLRVHDSNYDAQTSQAGGSNTAASSTAGASAGGSSRTN